MKSIAMAGQQAARSSDPALLVRIDYVNWRGERGIRSIVPQRLYYGEVEWHEGPQWILDAWDIEKEATRSFALSDIQRWGV